MGRKLALPNVERTASGLRAALFDEMDCLRNGKSDSRRAQAVARLGTVVLKSVECELAYYNYVQSAVDKDRLPLSARLSLADDS